MNIEKETVLQTLITTMDRFIDTLDELPQLHLNEFSSQDTPIVMIDMINGFCKFGPLSSPYVEALIPEMSRFLDDAIAHQHPIVSYRDSHPESTSEFEYFPPHCLSDSDESNLVDELLRPELIDIPKNSTNGFLAKNPLTLFDHSIKNVIVIGCVTDICVRDFSSTMNKYFQEANLDGHVYLVENLVDTFHIEGVHDRQCEHLLALYQLSQAGIRLYRY